MPFLGSEQMMYSYYLKYSCCGMNVQTCNLCCVKIIVYLFHLLIIKSCHFSGKKFNDRGWPEVPKFIFEFANCPGEVTFFYSKVLLLSYSSHLLIVDSQCYQKHILG